MRNVTVREAFEAAIGVEKASEQFFQWLEEKFRYIDEISRLWKEYAKDETQHAIWLGDLKTRLGQDELDKVVDQQTVLMLDVISRISVEKALNGIHDLEDAYELVNEIEHGETNAIFRFLVDNFEPGEKMRGFLRGQLNDHVGLLVDDLPPQYRGAAARRKVKAAG